MAISVVNTLAPTFLIGSSSFFHVTRTVIKDSHEILDENEIRQDSTMEWGVNCFERLKKIPIDLQWERFVNAPAPSFLIGSSSFLQVTRTAIRAQMSLKFSKIRP